MDEGTEEKKRKKEKVKEKTIMTYTSHAFL